MSPQIILRHFFMKEIVDYCIELHSRQYSLNFTKVIECGNIWFLDDKRNVYYVTPKWTFQLIKTFNLDHILLMELYNDEIILTKENGDLYVIKKGNTCEKKKEYTLKLIML